jgi:hypothetical protein
MAQGASRRPLTVDAQVRHPASPCETCVVQSGAGTEFSLSTSASSVIIFPPKSILIFNSVLLTEGQTADA